jgi:hypothetical protein
MRKWGSVLLLAVAGFVPGLSAAADETEQGLATLWEVLWHQSGTPTRVVRWEQDIKVRLSGSNLPPHREHILTALRTVTQEAGVKLIDVSNRPEEPANLTVEVVADNALEDNQPCVTFLNFNSETRIESAGVQLRGKDAWRCAYHEAMHVMGVRGHPAGKTVLSYFPWRVDGLLPLDRVMLRAWYSPRMRGGMTPFEALPVLADELVATADNKDEALLTRDRFLVSTIQQAQLYASGKGDIPAVVKRSGKSTEEGIRYGRREMSYFLGIAYLEGASVAPDRGQAVKWLQQAADQGNRPAQVRLSSGR